MHLKSLRALIRLSIKQKILAENRKMSKPLETFSDFKHAVQNALIKEGLDDVVDNNLEEHIFLNLYSVWTNIQTEMKFVSLNEKISVWNDSVSFHLPVAIENIVRVISQHKDVSKVTKNVVCSLLK